MVELTPAKRKAIAIAQASLALQQSTPTDGSTPIKKLDVDLSKAPDIGGLKGYLDDPKADQRAYDAAVKRFEKKPPGKIHAAGLRAISSASLNVDRPVNGLISFVTEEGNAYGKAKDRYFDDMVAERAGEMGDLASIAGAILSPAGRAKSLLGLAIKGGSGAAFEGVNLSTEGDKHGANSILWDAIVGAGGGSLSKVFGNLVSSHTVARVINHPIIRFGKYAAAGVNPALLLLVPLQSAVIRKSLGKGIEAVGPGVSREIAKQTDPQTPLVQPAPPIQQTPAPMQSLMDANDTTRQFMMQKQGATGHSPSLMDLTNQQMMEQVR